MSPSAALHGLSLLLLTRVCCSCPWCHVGDKRLAKAMGAYNSRSSFELVWHPYIIDPGTKQEGEEYLAYKKRRGGSDSWTHHLRAQVGLACSHALSSHLPG